MDPRAPTQHQVKNLTANQQSNQQWRAPQRQLDPVDQQVALGAHLLKREQKFDEGEVALQNRVVKCCQAALSPQICSFVELPNAKWRQPR